MLTEKMERELNSQINKEFYSEYLYLSMASYADKIGLAGIAKWFKAQAAEEHTHGMKLYDFIYDMGGTVVIEGIEKPQSEFESVKELFDLSLKHEKFVTSSIHKLVDLAIAENDHATNSFLRWFVDEQVEEEATVNAILDKLSYMKDSGIAMIMLDRELGART
jgi:ferritin